jgi:hypothetical protein
LNITKKFINPIQGQLIARLILTELRKTALIARTYGPSFWVSAEPNAKTILLDSVGMKNIYSNHAKMERLLWECK